MSIIINEHVITLQILIFIKSVFSEDSEARHEVVMNVIESAKG